MDVMSNDELKRAAFDSNSINPLGRSITMGTTQEHCHLQPTRKQLDATSIQSKTILLDNAQSDQGFSLVKKDNRLSHLSGNEWPREANILLYRCLKTACHELCHVLGMTHCPYYECLMNGSNLVTEADAKPFALCPICLKKLVSYFEI